MVGDGANGKYVSNLFSVSLYQLYIVNLITCTYILNIYSKLF